MTIAQALSALSHVSEAPGITRCDLGPILQFSIRMGHAARRGAVDE
jgi:hypothetical protein